MFKHKYPVSYFRNFIFGVEDSLVSTVGLLSGIAVAGMSKEDIFLTGIVLIFVEAFSMGAGSFIAESSADEFTTGKEKVTLKNIFSGLVMFISYFISGFIPLSSYLFLPVGQALYYSILFSTIALFVLGLVGAKISKGNLLLNGIRVVVIGGIAIILGLIVGTFASTI
ncbi:MAG: VIT1/CCC1 transporter family protein [Candidatus Paceibacterota bacterium]|jgi:VIT1/CCC1 family predicted Fe2+/Mn2+ transporter